jgi:hypothetical protein
MRPTEKTQFAALLSNVYGFYEKTATPFVIDTWWGALQAYDFDAVSRAFGQHSVNPDDGQYLPRPANIVKMLSGTTNDAGLVAWSKVEKAVARVGTYESVVFDDPLIHRVIEDMGGWIRLGTFREDEMVFVGKEFVNRYRGYRMRSDRPEYLRVLTGIAESNNAKVGFDTAAPVLIGESSKAKLVLEGGTSKAAIGFTRANPEMLEVTHVDK